MSSKGSPYAIGFGVVLGMCVSSVTVWAFDRLAQFTSGQLLTAEDLNSRLNQLADGITDVEARLDDLEANAFIRTGDGSLNVPGDLTVGGVLNATSSSGVDLVDGSRTRTYTFAGASTSLGSCVEGGSAIRCAYVATRECQLAGYSFGFISGNIGTGTAQLVCMRG